MSGLITNLIQNITRLLPPVFAKQRNIRRYFYDTRIGASTVWRSAHNQQRHSRRKMVVDAAMNHWFVCNKGVTNKNAPLTYDPYENLAATAGPAPSLAKFERIWDSPPSKEQHQHASEHDDFWRDFNQSSRSHESPAYGKNAKVFIPSSAVKEVFSPELNAIAFATATVDPSKAWTFGKVEDEVMDSPVEMLLEAQMNDFEIVDKVNASYLIHSETNVENIEPINYIKSDAGLFAVTSMQPIIEQSSDCTNFEKVNNIRKLSGSVRKAVFKSIVPKSQYLPLEHLQARVINDRAS